ncbi:uncharacterized protein LOC110730637 [Chenopodium quinoa]|uniref:uncharacterized protein LOC110730637 n=1 Tax=Chenopodium quinoa TaxID=63459 RepID=UPI000B78C6F7|nr:uncharacterized protein LOC110730637 [Chenopodium quinoa]
MPILPLLEEYAKGIIESRSEDSRFCHVTACGSGEFEVRDGHVNFPVTLGNKTCGCGKWQGSRIPCKHGLRVIYNQRLQATDYVSSYFKGAAYKMTYGDHIHPMSDPTHWTGFDVLEIALSTVKRSAGRPAKQRRRGPNEAKKGKRHKNNKCNLCKELGHNALTCKARKEAAKKKQQAANTSKQAKGRGRNRKADTQAP